MPIIKEEKMMNIEKIIFFGSVIKKYFLRFIFNKLIGDLNIQKQNRINANSKNISDDNLILTLKIPINTDKKEKLNFKKLSLLIIDKYIM